jgi:cellobiose phosphorylase
MTRRTITTPLQSDLGLATIENRAGLAVSVLPNGSLFAIEHRGERSSVLINQVLGQPAHGGIGRLYLRVGGDQPVTAELVGPAARIRFGRGERSLVWEGQAGGIRHRVVLELDEAEPVWLWRVELTTPTEGDLPCDVVLVQDVGLGGRGFVMGSEAYVSQYVDHHVALHPSHGPVIMCRQAQRQDAGYPWLAIGLLEGAASFATDAIQVLGPEFRVSGDLGLPFGSGLPGERMQHEVACPMLQSRVVRVSARQSGRLTFFARFQPDHPDASGDADLATLASVPDMARRPPEEGIAVHDVARSILQDAPLLQAETFEEGALARLFPSRVMEERVGGRLMSFFVPEGAQNRHVVLRDKDRLVQRRHGAMLRSGGGMTLDERTLCATHWMHGVFAAQLTIGNTSFHKLFSVSRDPYNLTRASGLRILADTGEGWRLLGVPSAFDIGLSQCRWIYRQGERTITVTATADGDAPAMLWRILVEGPPARFLVVGHVVLGEREFESSGTIEIDGAAKRMLLKPDRESLWGRTCKDAAYHLVTATPDQWEAIGGDELIDADGAARAGPYIAWRSRPTSGLSFAVAGSMTDAGEGAALAQRYAEGVEEEAMLAPARLYWSRVTRNARITGEGPDVDAQNAFLPWLAHDAMIHLTVPHGLEQYTGAAWGTRDVCQGPIEFLLSMQHDETVRDILKVVFSEQNESRGDWPQWFMLEPYSQIRAGGSHGDVIIWPLKALCDYVEETGDVALVEERLPWREDGGGARSTTVASVADHVAKLLATVRERFIPGTRLIRYGEGDWNDSLQPVDPHWPDWMVSSWTVALLYEQVERYAAILQRIGRDGDAASLRDLAVGMREDFNRHLMRDGIVAGYGLFSASGGEVELLLHPSDRRTGIRFSLIPMTQAILASLFTPEQTRRHLELIADELSFPDGVRLMDRPLPYRGGVETLFRRAESAAFFGREIGLMYVHAHLRYCEALATQGDGAGLWEGLALVNPIAVTTHLRQASLRQRNAYFSSSDAAFKDRDSASTDWADVKAGTVAVDGGWRIYSSGPGLYTNVLVRHAFGRRRSYGERSGTPVLPPSLAGAKLSLAIDA